MSSQRKNSTICSLKQKSFSFKQNKYPGFEAGAKIHRGVSHRGWGAGLDPASFMFLRYEVTIMFLRYEVTINAGRLGGVPICSRFFMFSGFGVTQVREKTQCHRSAPPYQAALSNGRDSPRLVACEHAGGRPASPNPRNTRRRAPARSGRAQ
jgi:hypothetical protein